MFAYVRFCHCCKYCHCIIARGRNSSLVVYWAHCPAWCCIVGLILLWGEFFLVEGIFPLELLTWIQTPFPQNSWRWEYKVRSSLCTHSFHHTDSKDPDIHVLDRWIPVTKPHPACTIHECDYLHSWIQKRLRTQKSHLKWWTPEI